MRRRDFITLLGAAAAWPQQALARVTSRRPLIAWLAWGAQDDSARNAALFIEGMRGLNHDEGRDFDMVYRFADFHRDRLPKLAAELVKLDPDVIIAPLTIAALAAGEATTTIPIVVPILAAPRAGRPGGNLTGISPYLKGVPAQLLELARETLPGASRIGLLDDVNDPRARLQSQEIKSAAQKLNVKLVAAEVRGAADIPAAYAALASERVEIVVVEQSGMFVSAREQIAAAAAARKLPSVYGYREHVEAGGLISYGVNLSWCFRRAAYYVDRILEGAKPADLPVEYPNTLELVINLKTAKALGFEVPPGLLARADEVIE
jgi:putative ABC transport system substrate-binding protein